MNHSIQGYFHLIQPQFELMIFENLSSSKLGSLPSEHFDKENINSSMFVE